MLGMRTYTSFQVKKELAGYWYLGTLLIFNIVCVWLLSASNVKQNADRHLFLLALKMCHLIGDVNDAQLGENFIS